MPEAPPAPLPVLLDPPPQLELRIAAEVIDAAATTKRWNLIEAT
jgi:hypothetical protein